MSYLVLLRFNSIQNAYNFVNNPKYAPLQPTDATVPQGYNPVPGPTGQAPGLSPGLGSPSGPVNVPSFVTIQVDTLTQIPPGYTPGNAVQFIFDNSTRTTVYTGPSIDPTTLTIMEGDNPVIYKGVPPPATDPIPYEPIYPQLTTDKQQMNQQLDQMLYPNQTQQDIIIPTTPPEPPLNYPKNPYVPYDPFNDPLYVPLDSPLRYFPEPVPNSPIITPDPSIDPQMDITPIDQRRSPDLLIPLNPIPNPEITPISDSVDLPEIVVTPDQMSPYVTDPSYWETQSPPDLMPPPGFEVLPDADPLSKIFPRAPIFQKDLPPPGTGEGGGSLPAQVQTFVFYNDVLEDGSGNLVVPPQIWVSFDGYNWGLAVTTGLFQWVGGSSRHAYQNGLWVIIGDAGPAANLFTQVLSSTNGTTWNTVYSDTANVNPATSLTVSSANNTITVSLSTPPNIVLSCPGNPVVFPQVNNNTGPFPGAITNVRTQGTSPVSFQVSVDGGATYQTTLTLNPGGNGGAHPAFDYGVTATQPNTTI